MSYNGWTNYETWNVALWIDNEPGLYDDLCEVARGADDASDLARELKAYVEGMAPDLGASMFSDLLNAALSEVNWYEIAEKWYAEAHEAEDEERERTE